jgi:hypothetical protein
MSRAKTPTKEYYRPILQALVDMGGSAPITSVMQRVEELMRARLTTVDYAPLQTGGKRWEKSTNFAKKDLADGLLLRSDRANWYITDQGREFLRSGHMPIVPKVHTDDTLLYLRQNRDKLLEVKKWFEKDHGRDSVDLATLEASLRQLFRD